MTPHQPGMHTGQATVWDTEDDFDDDLPEASPPAAAGHPPFHELDDWDDDDSRTMVPAPSPPPPPREVSPAAPTPTGRKAASTTAAPIATSAAVDDGVQFGNDPDFDFVGSHTYGAVFDIPGAADILRTANRPDTQQRRGRGRTATLEREPEAAVPSILDADPEPAVDARKAAREERIAANREERARKADERKQQREARAAERAEKSKAKSADRAVKKLSAESSGSAANPRRNLLLAGAGLAVVGVVGAAALAFTGGDEARPADTEAPAVIAGATTSSAADTATPASADTDCPTQIAGKVVTGRDAGDTTTGVGAIKAFNYAYYTDRDAAAASSRVLPSAAKAVIGSESDLQRAIDAVPAGTTHCLTITDRGNDLYATELTQIPPGGGAPEVYRQLIKTVRDDDTSVITSITATY